MPNTIAPAETLARILRTEPVAAGSWLFTLEAEEALTRARPGQFVQIEVPGPHALRRPFSVAGEPAPGLVEILVEARGAATRTLSALPEGTEVAVSGPLGRPFNDHPKNAAALLIAGGIGVAGLRLLASELLADGTPVIALIGATTADRLLDETLPRPGDSKRLRIELATDDGTAGHEGTVCDLLRSHEEHLPEACHAYICGPRAMIDSAGGMALDMGLGASALLEETMACGVGACRGCVVATRNGYRSVCGEGPVFDVRDLLPERDDDA